jgi:hemolysin III
MALPGDEAPKVKPALRGVSHELAAYAAAIAGGALLVAAPPAARLPTGVYVATLLALFGVSALYHRVTWDPARRALMKRLDHSTIFLFIAGSYTPLGLLAIGGPTGTAMVSWAWAGAAAGLVQAVFVPRAPKAVTAALYVALGWIVVAYLPAVAGRIDPLGLALLVAGGVLYSVGAAVYARRRPDPVPHVFGYHEVFHALVVVACACHFVAIARVVVQVL